MDIAALLGLLDDRELERMKSRAWWRAVRVWQEARAAGLSNTVRMMLVREAESEDAFVNACLAEISRRREAAA